MMEKSPNSCTCASLVALAILMSFPVRSWCREEIYESLTVVRPMCCVGEAAESKRSGDIDYNSFVSLMGRRSVAQTNSHRNIPMTRKRHVDLILADLLRRSRSE